jgi:hypothetical protein
MATGLRFTRYGNFGVLEREESIARDFGYSGRRRPFKSSPTRVSQAEVAKQSGAGDKRGPTVHSIDICRNAFKENSRPVVR